MSLDDVGAPGQGQAGDNRVAVSVDAGRESVKAGKVVLADGVEPLREPFALTLGEHVGEGADVTGQGIEFRAVGQDGLARLTADRRPLGIRRRSLPHPPRLPGNRLE